MSNKESTKFIIEGLQNNNLGGISLGGKPISLDQIHDDSIIHKLSLIHI